MMMNAVVLSLFLFVAVFYAAIITTIEGHGKWTYKDQDNWKNDENSCGGSLQSPINIESPILQEDSLKVNFEFGSQKEATVKNNGHTAEVSFEDETENVVSASGSALNDETFVFRQLHFHWGENDNEGSEHALNGQTFSAEVHFVFFNSKYGDFKTAVGNEDGITVFGMFLEASDEDNDNLAPITDSLDQITKAKSKSTINLNLSTLFPRSNEKFYRYSGSLTTPPCSEVVNWIVFDSPIKIGKSQLEKFRQLEDKDGSRLEAIWRFLQNRNERLIRSSEL